MNQPAPSLPIPRPAGRYYGSKWRLAPWIVSHLPDHVTYAEPFCGLASVLLRKPIARNEAINDADDEVVNFLRVLREEPAALVRAIQFTPWSEAEVELAKRFEDGLSPLERARRFYLLCQQTYSGGSNTGQGGWRYERTGRRNTRMVDEFASVDHLNRIANRLLQVQINCTDWRKVISRYDSPETCFYVDPPYLPETRCQQWRKGGYRHDLTVQEHVELADALHQVRGMVVLSGYPSTLYDELYNGWTVETRSARIDGGRRIESLWLSPSAAGRRRQKTLWGEEL